LILLEQKNLKRIYDLKDTLCPKDTISEF